MTNKNSLKNENTPEISFQNLDENSNRTNQHNRKYEKDVPRGTLTTLVAFFATLTEPLVADFAAMTLEMVPTAIDELGELINRTRRG